MNEEMIRKAKEVKSAEELLALAKENGIELTGEQEKALLDRFHAAAGELSDDELDGIVGGWSGFDNIEPPEDLDRNSDEYYQWLLDYFRSLL